MSRRALDLFCGAAGGWSLGLHRAGYRTVAACEIDPWRQAVFAANFPGARMYEDVRGLSADQLVRDLGYLPDVIVGSPPCQGASAANTRGRGVDDPRTGLFFEAVRLVGECRPAWACFENSPRLRTRGADRIIDALEALDYAVWPLVVGADDAGAPHRRKRLWLIAVDPDRQRQHVLAGHVEMGGGMDEPAADATRRPARTGPNFAQSEPGTLARKHASDATREQMGHGGQPRESAAIASNSDCNRRQARQAKAKAKQERSNDDDGTFSNAPNTDSAGQTLRPSLADDDGAQLPAALRDFGRAWPDWNGGLAGLAASCATAGFGRVDDGCASGLAPDLRNRCISAYGDAVLPQITEAIGRAMRSVSRGA